MLAYKKVLSPDIDVEGQYSKLTPMKHRKKFAQFFTPLPIANLMAQWILGNRNLKHVLEPAFGLGVFSRAILAHKKDVNIKAFEVDEHIASVAKNHFSKNKNISILQQDYMYNDWNNKYDGIICNPPYFKFHDYDNKNVIKEIEANLHCKLNGFTNLYALFLLKSIHQLNKNGRSAYIIPSEFLNSDYGQLVKSYLIKSKTLRHVFVIDFGENVFDDALTTASIIFCANDNKSEAVQFTNIQSVNEMAQVAQVITDYPNYKSNERIHKFSELNPAIKWKAYYQKQNRIKFKKLVPFSNFAKVVRGIATGSNDFFTFNLSKAHQFSIGEQYLLPCICKAVDSKKTFFTSSDFELLKDADKSIYLLNAIAPIDENVNSYINKGLSEDIHRKFLTSKRSPWYALEKRPPAPIWVSVFNRKGLRFIRNEANISNLTTFHCIYPVETDLFLGVDIDLLFAYLLTDTAKEIFEDNSREYGNGLQKFEPNDLNKGMALDLTIMDKQTKERILKLYRQYRLETLEGNSSKNYLTEINDIFISEYT